MRYIILTRDKELALSLVSHHTILTEIVFYYNLSSPNIIKYIDSDIDLVNELNREVVFVVHYDDNELRDALITHYKDTSIEVEVVKGETI